MVQNKHIIRLSFIGLFINILANIVLYRYYIIEEVVLKQAFDQNRYIAQAYKDNIWNNNHLATSYLKDYKYDSLLRNKYFIKFVKESSSFFKRTSSVITLYDREGNKILTNTDASNLIMKNKSEEYLSLYGRIVSRLDQYFLKDYMHNNALEKSLNGKTVNSLIASYILLDKKNNIYEKSFIESYIPIINSSVGEFYIESVLRIKTDITNQWGSITYLEKRIFIAFLIVFMVFFIIIVYNTSYAQAIINKQHDTNRELELAKVKAETESYAKTKFLANMTHELRTPLNAIIGFSDIMIRNLDKKSKGKQHRKYIADINASGRHLLSIINDILDFSKAYEEKLCIEKSEIDLNKLVSSSIRIIKPKADESGVKLLKKMPRNHIVIIADQKRLKQVLFNILSNSVKFTQANGIITVAIKKNVVKKSVDIIISDTGIGMNEKDLPKALSSFGQIDSSLSRKYEGTGLGLPLAKKLVKLMDGKFDLQSSKNIGTKVTLTFKYTDNIEL